MTARGRWLTLLGVLLIPVGLGLFALPFLFFGHFAELGTCLAMVTGGAALSGARYLLMDTLSGELVLARRRRRQAKRIPKARVV